MGRKQEMPLTFVVYEDGTEEEARGYVWIVDRKYYFDKFARGQRTVWVERFNQMYGQKVTSRKEIFELIGQENFTAFKRKWAAQNLKRVVTYKILERDTTYSLENLIQILSPNLSAADKQIFDLWMQSRNNAGTNKR